MPLRIVDQAGRSDVGRQRNANEDSLVLAPPFYAVADGMGGARAGEVASSLAAGVFDEEGESGEPPETRLTRLAQEANRRIFKKLQTIYGMYGMEKVAREYVSAGGHDHCLGGPDPDSITGCESGHA